MTQKDKQKQGKGPINKLYGIVKEMKSDAGIELAILQVHYINLL